jgi:hypothetical protein
MRATVGYAPSDKGVMSIMSVGTTTISALHYDKTTMLWHNRGHDFELRDNSYEHTVKIAKYKYNIAV